jgi:Bacterial dnaA protein helix-turn-helix
MTVLTAKERAVALALAMPAEGLHLRSTRAVTVSRHIAMYLVKQMTDASLPEIERHFGGKHHYADVSKIEIDLEDHDISEGNTKDAFDPALVELKRFAQKRWPLGYRSDEIGDLTTCNPAR